jgi:E3 ubiquitin-protein ligase synoviolin
MFVEVQVYLGRLRESEVERITERFHHGIVEICLTLTVFRQDFDARLVILMGVLAMIKVFHWLIQDRINYIQTESVITPLQHIRIVSFLSILTVRCFLR